MFGNHIEIMFPRPSQPVGISWANFKMGSGSFAKDLREVIFGRLLEADFIIPFPVVHDQLVHCRLYFVFVARPVPNFLDCFSSIDLDSSQCGVNTFDSPCS